MSIKYILVALVTVLCWGYTSDVKAGMQSGDVVVMGQVLHRDSASPRTVRIVFSDPLYTREKVYKLGEDGKFCLSGKMLFSQNITVVYGEYFDLYVHPGDTVKLKLDASRLTKEDLGGVEFWNY